jgi:hypothetical protein
MIIYKNKLFLQFFQVAFKNINAEYGNCANNTMEGEQPMTEKT